MRSWERRAGAGVRRAVLASALASAVGGCDFQYDIDPYTQYYGLEPDYSAYSSTDCVNNCCADVACDVWQYTDMPGGGFSNCMRGVSYDYGDSGGIYWSGGEGRMPDDPGGDEGGGASGTKKKKACRGVHCESDFGATLLIIFGCFSGLYLTGGTYYGVAVQKKSGLAALPNAGFWSDLGGLVRDGATFALSGGKTKGQAPVYQPVPDAEAPPVGAQPQPQVVAAAVAVAPAGAQPERKKKKKRRVKKVKKSPSARPSSSGGGSSME